MSERSSHQRKYLIDARKAAALQLGFTISAVNAEGYPDWDAWPGSKAIDLEDAQTLLQLEVAKRVASDMFLGGLYGVQPGTTLEEYIRQHQASDEETTKKDELIAELKDENDELRRKLGQVKGGQNK